MNQQNKIFEILKYIVLVSVIFMILKYLPNQKMNCNDTMLASIIIAMVYLLVEKIIKMCNNKQDSFSSVDKANLCNSVCGGGNINNNIEQMTDIPSNDNPENTPDANNTDIPMNYQDKDQNKDHDYLNNNTDIPTNDQDKDQNKDHNYLNNNTNIPTNDNTANDYQYQYKYKIKPYQTKVNQEDDGTTLITGPHTKLKYSDGRNKVMITKPSQECNNNNNNIDSDDEAIYSDYYHLPLEDTYNKNGFEYGYSFLPPEKWYPQPPVPPVCITDKRCPVIPTYTNGSSPDTQNWESLKISKEYKEFEEFKEFKKLKEASESKTESKTEIRHPNNINKKI